MISWLKGKQIDSWINNSKKGIIISCGGIGYEVQLLPRQLNECYRDDEITLWIHQVFREDGIIMFGFKEKLERNFFRKLIEINGVGPQIAIALLQEYKYQDLIITINNESITKLTKVSGVGKRIAERITMELRDKLSEFQKDIPSVIQQIPTPIENSKAQASPKEEVMSILKNLEYEDSEIIKALKAAENELAYMDKDDSTSEKDEVIDAYLKKSLVWLSQEVSLKGT
tara:strand:- start:7613 stop:8296 length:684 start_codon:yes stop_codon:yes gene_type:complete